MSKRIINVNVNKQTGSISKPGFGVPCVFTYHTKTAARMVEFGSADAMLAAAGGPFASSDMAYKLVAQIYAQNPSVTKVKVARRINPTIRTVLVTPKSGLVNGETLPLNLALYRITINGTNFDYTTDATALVAEICTGLTALINAGAENVLATDGGTTVNIEKAVTPGGVATAGEAFTISCDRKLMSMKDNTPAAAVSMTDEIANLRNVDDDWYALVGDWFGATEIAVVAAAIETMPKIHDCSSSDDEIYDPVVTTDIVSIMQALSYERTRAFHHPKADLGISAADLGKNLPKNPGSVNWMFKKLVGIAPEVYTDGEIAAMTAKNCEFYSYELGNPMVSNGKAVGGEWIDVTRFIDWYVAELKAGILSPLLKQDKVPFTNPGIGTLENEVRAATIRGINRGGIAADPAPVYKVPNAIVGSVGGVSANDKANRRLDAIEVCVILAGAINHVELNVKVTN